MIESPPHDLLPLLAKDKNIKLVDRQPARQPVHLPLQRAAQAVRQREDPPGRARMPSTRRTSSTPVIGDPKYYKDCKAMFICGTPLETTKGWEDKLESNFDKSKAAPEGSGLRRHARRADAIDRPRTCSPTSRRSPRTLLEKGGFKVDMQAMDWQTLVAPPRQEGSAGRGRLERLPDLVGRGRHPRSGDGRLLQRRLRQGDVRLAVRRADREAARRLRQGDRPGQAEGDRRGRPGARCRSIRRTSISGSGTRPSRCAAPSTASSRHRRQYSGTFEEVEGVPEEPEGESAVSLGI